MIKLRLTEKNMINKYETLAKIKKAIKKLVNPAVQKDLKLKDVLYNKVTIDELFY